MEDRVVQIIIQLCFIVGMLSLLWKIGQDNNEKIGIVFKRFDQHKGDMEKHMKDNYVHKDVHKIQLEHNNKDIERLEKKVDDGFHAVDKKLDRIINNGKPQS